MCPMRSPVLFIKPLLDHLVIGVERTVEKDERRVLEPRAQGIVEPGTARDEEEMVPVPALYHLQADRVAFLRAVISLGVVGLEIERNLARHGEGLDGDADRP